MLSTETFRRMAGLSKKIEQGKIEEELYPAESGQKFIDYISNNYLLVKVNIPGTNNYTFQLKNPTKS